MNLKKGLSLILLMLSMTMTSNVQAKKSQTGVASWYGYTTVTVRGKHGKKITKRAVTANGEIFNPSEMTAAHKTLPFGTKVKVTNLSNKQVVMVRISDRGPFVKGRIIDLSKGAAKKIHLDGVGKVKLDVI